MSYIYVYLQKFVVSLMLIRFGSELGMEDYTRSGVYTYIAVVLCTRHQPRHTCGAGAIGMSTVVVVVHCGMKF